MTAQALPPPPPPVSKVEPERVESTSIIPHQIPPAPPSTPTIPAQEGVIAPTPTPQLQSQPSNPAYVPPINPEAGKRPSTITSKLLWIAGGLALIGVVGYAMFGTGTVPTAESTKSALPVAALTSAPAPQETPQAVVPAEAPAPAPAPAIIPVPEPEPELTQKAQPPTPKSTPPIRTTHWKNLDQDVFLAPDKTKRFENGNVEFMIVANNDIPAGRPLSGKVNSQILFGTINCISTNWARRKLSYYTMPDGEGQRIHEEEWRGNDIKWFSVATSDLWVRNAFEKLCKSSSTPPTPLAVAPAPSVPNAPTPPSEPATPNHLTRLSNITYLFKDSVKKSGEDYRIMLIVDNAGIGPGKPLSDQVRSQVYRTVINCKNNTWAYDQLYWYDQLFGKGSSLSEQKWQPNQLAWNAIAAGTPVERAYRIACPVTRAAAPAPAAIPIN